MAYVVEHIPCPKCKSRDNVGLYSDGSEWCFGCGYYKPPAGMARIRNAVRPDKEVSSANGDIVLPTDATYRLQEEHLAWLRKYGITTKEIINYRIMSSPSRGLILPIFDGQGKYLKFFINRPMMEGQPKSIDNGKKPMVLFGSYETTKHPDLVVLVEDYISAMKVSRQFFCVPLFGSMVSADVILKLQKKFKTVVYWLDPDKYLHSVRTMLRYGYVMSSVAVKSEQDPKEHTDRDIYNFVTEAVG